jgi:glycosyltransferase involved in cell wall biosynthesis
LMNSVSIVTINYNNLAGLMKTVNSVLNQKGIKPEYIIVDGGSTDGSAEYILANNGLFSKIIIEKDKGIYDAQNKGVLNATGDYILFLNGGDWFKDENSLASFIPELGNYDILYGDIIYKKEDQENEFQYPDTIDEKFMLSKGMPHQSTLIRRNLFEKTGLHKLNYRICADWDFFMHAFFIHNATRFHVKNAISVFDCTGISSTIDNIQPIIDEHLLILNSSFPQLISLYKKHSYYLQKRKKMKLAILKKNIKKLIRKYITK